MQTISQVLAANQPWVLNVPSSFMQLVEAALPVDIRFMQGGRVVSNVDAAESGFYCDVETFDRVEIVSTNNQQIKILLSDGKAGSSRIAGSVTATVKTAAGIVNVPFKTVGTGEVLAAAANANRMGLRFLNAGGTNIALGGAGLAYADAVIVLAPGQLWVESEAPAAAWVALSDMPAGVLKIQELTA